MDGHLGIDKRKLSVFFFEQNGTVFCFLLPLLLLLPSPLPPRPCFMVLRNTSKAMLILS